MADAVPPPAPVHRPPQRFAALRAALSALLILAWLAFALYYITTWWDQYTLWQNVLILLGSLIALSMLNTVVSPFKGWEGAWERSWERDQRHAWREARRRERAQARAAGERGTGAADWEGWDPHGWDAPPWRYRPATRMPEGLRPRVTVSIVAGLAWALFLVLDAAFLWGGMTLSQNLALVVGSLLVVAAAMVAVWVPWGMRFAEVNHMWEPWDGEPGPDLEEPGEARAQTREDPGEPRGPTGER